MFDQVEPAKLPQGRLLYRPLDDARYVVVSAPGTVGYWIVEDGWSNESQCAGPFLPDETLRALRLSNTRVPDGCELGPWQSGLALFQTRQLPAHPNEWSRAAPTWLPPGVTFYRGIDAGMVVNETCCSPSVDLPRVSRGKVTGLASSEIESLVQREPDGAGLRLLGVLLREWNAHPKGSPVCGAATTFDRDFAVVDLPPEA